MLAFLTPVVLLVFLQPAAKVDGVSDWPTPSVSMIIHKEFADMASCEREAGPSAIGWSGIKDGLEYPAYATCVDVTFISRPIPTADQ